MVGRGRGRGSQMSGVEQLGFGVGESMPTPVLQPPPVYPPLENTPVPLRCNPEDEYCVELRRDFIESLRDSPAYLVTLTVRSDIERYSDRYQAAMSSKPKQQPLTYPVNHLPMELRPAVKSKLKRERAKKSVPAAAKAVDITSRLEELEKTEDQMGDAEEDEEQKGSEEKDAEDGEEKEEEEVEDPDEEMDDGTDYANNYFDNGEGFLDEDDDNLDDGPVY